ncbi:hypothetical protein GQX74_015580 [Glossina fuscipes]|nr:hypothetical protein GQX74_015580 [Glossina fuscipes]
MLNDATDSVLQLHHIAYRMVPPSTLVEPISYIFSFALPFHMVILLINRIPLRCRLITIQSVDLIINSRFRELSKHRLELLVFGILLLSVDLFVFVPCIDESKFILGRLIPVKKPLEILKRNLRTEIRKELLHFETTSLADLREFMLGHELLDEKLYKLKLTKLYVYNVSESGDDIIDEFEPLAYWT